MDGLKIGLVNSPNMLLICFSRKKMVKLPRWIVIPYIPNAFRQWTDHDLLSGIGL